MFFLFILDIEHLKIYHFKSKFQKVINDQMVKKTQKNIKNKKIQKTTRLNKPSQTDISTNQLLDCPVQAVDPPRVLLRLSSPLIF